MRTNEYFYILKREFGEKLKIESLETLTEWDTTWYEIIIYVEDFVMIELDKQEDKKERKQEYIENGIASCLDLESVGHGQEFEGAVEHFFWFCHDKNLLHINED